MSCDYALKVLVLGESGVGKTSFVQRFVKGRVPPAPTTTTGLDLRVKIITVGGRRVRLQIWDAAGDKAMCSQGSGCSIIYVLYDCTSRASFEQVPQWVKGARHAAPSANICIVATKCDAVGESVEVDEEDGRGWAEEQNFSFGTISSFDGSGVDAIFHKSTDVVIHRLEEDRAAGLSVDNSPLMPLQPPPSFSAKERRVLFMSLWVLNVTLVFDGVLFLVLSRTGELTVAILEGSMMLLYIIASTVLCAIGGGRSRRGGWRPALAQVFQVGLWLEAGYSGQRGVLSWALSWCGFAYSALLALPTLFVVGWLGALALPNSWVFVPCFVLTAISSGIGLTLLEVRLVEMGRRKHLPVGSNYYMCVLLYRFIEAVSRFTTLAVAIEAMGLYTCVIPAVDFVLFMGLRVWSGVREDKPVTWMDVCVHVPLWTFFYWDKHFGNRRGRRLINPIAWIGVVGADRAFILIYAGVNWAVFGGAHNTTIFGAAVASSVLVLPCFGLAWRTAHRFHWCTDSSTTALSPMQSDL